MWKKRPHATIDLEVSRNRIGNNLDALNQPARLDLEQGCGFHGINARESERRSSGYTSRNGEAAVNSRWIFPMTVRDSRSPSGKSIWWLFNQVAFKVRSVPSLIPSCYRIDLRRDTTGINAQSGATRGPQFYNAS